MSFTYDAVGNPLSYNNGTAWKFTWENAHDLATAKGNGKSISYHYDMDGVRDSKTVDGVKHEYITQGGNVTLERWNDGEEKSLEFIYDNGGAPYSVIYSRGNEVDTYYYILNQQGDVIRIVDTSGKTVAEYTYNGWGEILNVSNAKGSEIGTLNPIRYRGYYYDSELNMYYLQSRYYDPVMKRMIASDDESLTTGATLNNNNLFAYCDNNPVNRADTEGECWNVVAGALLGAGISGGVELLGEAIAGEKIDAKSVAIAAGMGAIDGGLAAIGCKPPSVRTFEKIYTVASEVKGIKDEISYQKKVYESSGEKTKSGVAMAVLRGTANIAYSKAVDHFTPQRSKRRVTGATTGKFTKKLNIGSKAQKKVENTIIGKIKNRGAKFARAMKKERKAILTQKLFQFHFKWAKWFYRKIRDRERNSNKRR